MFVIETNASLGLITIMEFELSKFNESYYLQVSSHFAGSLVTNELCKIYIYFSTFLVFF